MTISKYSVKPLSRQKINDLSRTIRKIFSFDTIPLYFDVVGFIESLFQFDESFSCQIVAKGKLPLNTYAQYLPVENKMEIDELVYDAACKGDYRHRFTLAHELGHYFLHNNVLALQRVAKNTNVPAYRDPEWQANTFASALLMPPNEVLKMDNIGEIQEKCGVSSEAAIYALKNAKKAKS